MLASLTSFITTNIELSVLSAIAVLLITLSSISRTFFFNHQKIVLFAIIIWAVSFSVYQKNGQSCLATIDNYLNESPDTVSQSQALDEFNDLPAPAAGFSAYGRIEKIYFNGGRTDKTNSEDRE